MRNFGQQILADAGDLLEVVFFIVLMIVAGLVKLAEKAQRAKAQKQTDEAIEARRREASATHGRHDTKAEENARLEMLRRRRQAMADAARAKVRPSLTQQPLPSAQKKSVSQFVRPTAAAQRPAQAQRPSPALRQRVSLETVAERVPTMRDVTDLDTVDEMIEQRQRDRLRQDAERMRRLASSKPVEADTAAIERKLLHLSRAEVPQMTAAATVHVDLTNPANLRQAIIYSEILSPPVGLRMQPAMWET